MYDPYETELANDPVPDEPESDDEEEFEEEMEEYEESLRNSGYFHLD